MTKAVKLGGVAVIVAGLMACWGPDAPPKAEASPASSPRPDGPALVDALLAVAVAPPGPDGVARVYYPRLAADGRPLSAALAWFAATDASTLPTPAARLAYWLNGYNTAMLSSVLRRWGGRADWSVSAEGFALFDAVEHDFGGRRLSLNQVEHGILRGDLGRFAEADRAWAQGAHRAVWGGRPVDARIHMALNCASVGCPNLAPRAYRGDTLEEQLRQQTRVYVDHDGRGAGPGGISQLFEWYASDFAAVGGPRAFILQHRSRPEAVNFGAFIPYDWALNAAPTP